jgi:hypothetical protein
MDDEMRAAFAELMARMKDQQEELTRGSRLFARRSSS